MDAQTLSIEQLARAARRAATAVATLTTERKNQTLLALAARLAQRQDAILQANAQDLQLAEAAGLASAKLQRLRLTASGLGQLCDGLRQVAALPDPVGAVVKGWTAPSGMLVSKVRTPLGVICMIYEARPGVTVDAFALCFKSGNACILKGGKEAHHSNTLLAAIVRETLTEQGVPPEAMTAFTSSSRDELRELLRQDASIDLVIPRGGHELIRFVAEHSRIPTVQHYQGVCHIFVHERADLEQSLRVCLTAKTSAPATCNAAECVLVDRAVAERFVPDLLRAYGQAGVEVRGDEQVARLGAGMAHVRPAGPEDFGREFLDLIVAMRVVDGLEGAIEHIGRYTSNHSEAILTEDQATATAFTQRVQASCVLVNASTRMNDGFALGLGAEIGISTTRVHAYGPMGLEELTTQRYVVEGSGQTR
ncbi:MAG: glutamate-5-semialdehyde dehydrogenase [Planctomycetaceae bacterium]|jgi:glutamate-5-semialdehyde dehydrogenase|nr:glutamate-5-semialdehyde dehydrogenase [Planctomycetaceae bacterium]